MIRLRMTRRLPEAGSSLLRERPTEPCPVHVRTDEREGFDALLFLAYLDGPDQEEDTVEEARAEIARTLDGGYGPLIPKASFVVRDAEGPVVATFVVLHGSAPLLAHVVVHPRAQGRGLGTSLMQRSIAALAERGHSEVTLAVPPDNRARRLYERLGFVVEGPPPRA